MSSNERKVRDRCEDEASARLRVHVCDRSSFSKQN
jgi:hypothetical protein